MISMFTKTSETTKLPFKETLLSSQREISVLKYYGDVLCLCTYVTILR